MVVKMHRASKGWPFEWAPGFCDRIQERRVWVNSMNLSRRPTTPPVYDLGIVHTPPRSDPESPSPPRGISLQSKRCSSPSVPISSSISDTEDCISMNFETKTSAAPADCPIGKEVLDEDIPGVTKEVSSSTDLYDSNQRRVHAMVQSLPPRRQVSKVSIPSCESGSESSTFGTETVEYDGVPESKPPKSLLVVSKVEPEVDHPQINTKGGIHASCMDDIVHARVGIDSGAFGSALCLHAAPPASSSSSSMSSSTSSSGGRSRSGRGIPSPVSSRADFDA